MNNPVIPSKTQELATYDASKHDRGASTLKFAVWTIISNLVFKTYLFRASSLKGKILRSFGANIGTGVVIKPNVSIRYPWKLSIGDDCWIGEDVWIENPSNVTIGNNVCISQSALILAGSHDYRKTTFDDNSKPIIIEDGVWIGARAAVCSGVTCKRNSILGVNAVATGHLREDTIYMAQRAVVPKKRVIQ